VLLALYLFGCNGSDRKELKTLYVDSFKVGCQGEAFQLCMRVREDESQGYSLFYDDIAGFDYQFGYAYKLLVTEEPIENPQQDASSLKTSLVAIEYIQEDEIGKNYHLAINQEIRSIVTTEDDGYRLFSYSFTCANDVDCNALLSTDADMLPVELSFAYSGNGEITLVDWSILE